MDSDSIIYFLTMKRLFIFFDEWLSYFILSYLMVMRINVTGNLKTHTMII